MTARALRRTSWFGGLPSHKRGGPEAATQPDLPPMLSGLALEESDVAWARRGRTTGACVIRDRRDRSVSAVLRVRGREFSLCERSEQDRLLQQWGDALAGFCRERGAVGRVRWTEWAAPAGHDEQLRYLDKPPPSCGRLPRRRRLPGSARAGRRRWPHATRRC